jgi:hypothetical protein
MVSARNVIILLDGGRPTATNAAARMLLCFKARQIRMSSSSSVSVVISGKQCKGFLPNSRRQITMRLIHRFLAARPDLMFD